MKKIIFCLQTMVLGGVENELITILKQFNYNEFDITVLLLYKSDESIIKRIPRNVKVISLNIDRDYFCSDIFQICWLRLKKKKILEVLSILTRRLLNIGMIHANVDISDIPLLNEKYDIAVCYHIHSPLMLKYTAQKIDAVKKIAWAHNDFRASGYPVNKLIKYLNEYDEVVAVSNRVKEEYCDLCRNYKGSVYTSHNILDKDEIVSKSTVPISDNIFIKENKVKVLTVGRFSIQKGFDIAIECAKLLKAESLIFHWYFIGYGEEEHFYRKLIKKYELSEFVTILGRKDNPYPYIKNCDIYVQPSRHEAWGLVIHEARILHKPIVCTDFAGADEQIETGVNGYIVPVNDIEALKSKIKLLICCQDERERLSDELKNAQKEDEWSRILSHFKER